MDKEKVNSQTKAMRIMRILKIARAAIAIAIFFVYFHIYYMQKYDVPMQVNMALLMLFVYTIAQFLLGKIYSAYHIGTASTLETVYSLCLTDIVCACIIFVVICLTLLGFEPIFPIVETLAFQTALNLLWAFFANKAYFKTHKPRPTVVIYRSDEDLSRLEELRHFTKKFDVKKYIRDPKDMQTILAEVQGYEVIFVAGIDIVLRNEVTKYCIENGVQGYFKPKVADIIMAGAKHMHMFSIPIIRVRRAAPPIEFLFMKRVFDMLASFLSMLVLSPIFLLTALMVKLYDGGPVFYRQDRLTKDRRTFKIYKFRSMRVDAEKDGVARLATEQDDRITPVGKVIRACRIDELPQLINILKGEMSIVGPRPERPEIAAQYEKAMPTFELRLQVRAGLTGYAQIYGRYNTEPYDKLQMDLMYINDMSVTEDLRLMFATIKILFMKDSTEGVAKGQVTAKQGKVLDGKEHV